MPVAKGAPRVWLMGLRWQMLQLMQQISSLPIQHVFVVSAAKTTYGMFLSSNSPRCYRLVVCT